MTEVQKKQELIFQAHQQEKGFHFTTDGTAFHEVNDAINHAKTLEDDTVEYIKNPKHKKKDDAVNTEETQVPVKKDTPAATKEKAPAKNKAKVKVPLVKGSEKVVETVAQNGVKTEGE